jgi:hypothetical protein
VSPPETPTPQDLSVARQVDQACNRFEAAWRTGQPRIEDHLEGWQGEERLALLRELVLLDVHHRRQRGLAVAREDYGERFPDLDPGWLEASSPPAGTWGWSSRPARSPSIGPSP